LLEPIEVARGYEIVYVDKVTDFYRTRDEYAELLTVDKLCSPMHTRNGSRNTRKTMI